MSDSVLFIQILDSTKLKKGSAKFEQFKQLEKSIQEVIPLKRSTLNMYRFLQVNVAIPFLNWLIWLSQKWEKNLVIKAFWLSIWCIGSIHYELFISSLLGECVLDVFNLRFQIVDDYSSFTRSFFHLQNPIAIEKINNSFFGRLLWWGIFKSLYPILTQNELTIVIALIRKSLLF